MSSSILEFDLEDDDNNNYNNNDNNLDIKKSTELENRIPPPPRSSSSSSNLKDIINNDNNIHTNYNNHNIHVSSKYSNNQNHPIYQYDLNHYSYAHQHSHSSHVNINVNTNKITDSNNNNDNKNTHNPWSNTGISHNKPTSTLVKFLMNNNDMIGIMDDNDNHGSNINHNVICEPLSSSQYPLSNTTKNLVGNRGVRSMNNSRINNAVKAIPIDVNAQLKKLFEKKGSSKLEIMIEQNNTVGNNNDNNMPCYDDDCHQNRKQGIKDIGGGGSRFKNYLIDVEAYENPKEFTCPDHLEGINLIEVEAKTPSNNPSFSRTPSSKINANIMNNQNILIHKTNTKQLGLLEYNSELDDHGIQTAKQQYETMFAQHRKSLPNKLNVTKRDMIFKDLNTLDINNNNQKLNNNKLDKESKDFSNLYKSQNNQSNNNSSSKVKPIVGYLNNQNSNSNKLIISKSPRANIYHYQDQIPSIIPAKGDIPKINSIRLENIIQNMIESADDNSIINLPAEHIKLPTLYLKKNITIKGSPGTILEITDSPIIIENDNPNSNNTNTNQSIKVSFCECTIQYNINKQKFMDNINTRSDSNSRRNLHKEFEDSFKGNDKRTNLNNTAELNNSDGQQNNISSRIYNTQDNQFVLFIIRSAVILEIRDCQISSLIKKTLITPEEIKYLNDIHDIAIYIQSTSTSKTSLKYPLVIVKSTNISDFSSFICADANANLNIQKCYFSNSRGHSINLLSPRYFKIIESMIENSDKSGINIRLSKDAFDDNMRYIYIYDNEIRKCNSYGVSIYGENIKHQNVNLKIEKNRFFSGKKDGIGIKFLNFPSIQIIKNEIRNNKGNGIFMQSINDTINNSQAFISENHIYNNEKNGVLIREAHSILENNDISQNFIHGVYLEYSEELTQDEVVYYTKNNIRIILNNCKIIGHNDYGIYISGSIKGPIIFSNCLINENLNGIVIHEKEWNSCINFNDSVAMNNQINNNIGLLGNKLRSPSQGSIPNKQYKTSQIGIKSKSKKGNIIPSISPVLATIAIDKCELAKNNNAGLLVQKIYCTCYITETIINANKDYAILLECIEDKNNVKLKDIERGKMRDYIQGQIGGTWGEIYESTKQASCKVTNTQKIDLQMLLNKGIS